MFKKVMLDNKIPLLMETSGEVHSVCIGVWVKVGARNELPEKSGISHFLEHMLFKGTEKRTAESIAMEIDSLGGELNAFTSAEYTLFYTKVLDEFMGRAVDLLTDIFLNSTLPEAEIEKEKNIVQEEIKMVEDAPSDYIHELFYSSIWGGHGLGQSVLGKRDTIDAFRRQDLIDHVEGHYGTENIIVACSGNFREQEIVETMNHRLGSLKRSSGRREETAPAFRSKVSIIAKDLSEAHLCLGIKGLSYDRDERFAMHLLNAILGSGFSSRLFQNVREKRGLVYSIYSYHVSYADTGFWSVYAGTDRKHVSEVINIAVQEMSNLPETLTQAELVRAKAQLKGNLILALESTSNKMTNIAKQEMYYGRYFTPQEIIDLVDAVSLDELKDLARKLIAETPFALTVYGPVEEADLKGVCTLLQ